MRRLAAIATATRESLLLCLLVSPVGLLAGSASALFLRLLDGTTGLNQANPWLLYLLPLAGLPIIWLYRNLGGESEQGGNLILGQIHAPGGGVPARMAPLVLVGTLTSHLFGASVGREGTAVQMGGSLASAYARLTRLASRHLGALLVAGIAAGFGSVFGTPLAGAVFAIEVLVAGRLRLRWLAPALAASYVAHLTCLAWGARHASYALGEGAAATDILLLGKVVVAALAFGLAARTFIGVSHGMTAALGRVAPSPYARVAIGGAALIGLVHLTGGWDYLGLGASSPDPRAVTIASAFTPGGAAAWSWWWKLLFTALCLSAGFKGGEVTPLFFIGATLGHALAGWLGAPVSLFAGLGLVAVFAGAANTPLACLVMGLELFGPAHALPLALACLVAFAASGRGSIYAAQRRPA